MRTCRCAGGMTALVYRSQLRANLGIAYLPCIVGDLEPELVRVDEPSSFKRSPIWILRHPDTRETARLKVFVDFLTDAVRAHYARLEGHFS